MVIFGLMVAVPATSSADTLTLKDGQVLKGTFKGMDGGNYMFEAFGNVMTVEADKVQSLEMEGQDKAPAAQPAEGAPASATPAPAPAAAPAGDTATVAAGTALLVKMQSGLVTDKSKNGDPFITVLEKDVSVGGNKVFSRGAKAYGRVVESVEAGRVAGRAKLVIQLHEIETGSGTVAIKTETQEYEGARSGTARKIAVGAAIGNVTAKRSYNERSYKKGAQEGAAFGGIVAVVTPGNQVAINPGTLVEFVLSDPVQVK